VFYHATFSAALSAIDHTEQISSSVHRIVPPFKLPSAGQPIDGLAEVYKNHVCLSIRPFWKFMAEFTWRTNNSVCLFAIDARVVYFQGVAFSPKLQRDASIAESELELTSISDFEGLFANSTTATPIHPSAKILVPGGIPTKYIRRVIFASEEEMKRAKEINPGDLGPCEVDPAKFPDVAKEIRRIAKWPETADEVEEFWMVFLGLVPGG
jgi:hypothetical protein